MTIDATCIGTRIREAREIKGWTITQAAIQLGIEAATLEDWENDITVPQANRLHTLAGVFETSILWLIGGSPRYEPTHLAASKIEIIAQKLEQANALQLELSALLAEIAMEVADIQHLEAELDDLAA